MGDVLRSRISEKRAKNASENFEMPIALKIINVPLVNFIENACNVIEFILNTQKIRIVHFHSVSFVRYIMIAIAAAMLNQSASRRQTMIQFEY